MNNIMNEQLIVGPFPPPVGGVSVSAMNLRRLLEEKNINVSIFSTSGEKEREDLYSSKKFTSYMKNIVLCVRYIYFLLFQFNGKICHVFTVSNNAFFRDFLFILISKLLGKKVIVHFHSKLHGEMFLSEKLLPILAFGVNRADKILVLSEQHYLYFSQVFKKENIEILENFVFSTDFTSCDINSSNFLYVGRLSKKKGFYDLIDAVDICVNQYSLTEFNIICLGLAESDQEQKRIEKTIEEKGLSVVLKLKGMVVGQEKFDYFNTSSCFLFPSHFENSPVVLKEAIAANLPIIASNIDANKSILERVGNSEFICVKDAIGFANKIKNIHDDLELRSKLSVNAKTSFKYDDKYAFDVIERLTNNI